MGSVFHIGAMDPMGNGAVDEHTGPDSLLPLYFVHI